MVRKYRIVHEPYLMEWLVKNFPPGTFRTNVRLGAVSPELVERTVSPAERRALKVFTAQADAIVLLKEKVIIIEALVRPEWWKIQQLKQYKKLFKSTIEFKEHWDKPIELVLLTTISSPFHEKMCAEEGIRLILYRPKWIEEYLQTLAARKRRPPGAAMIG